VRFTAPGSPASAYALLRPRLWAVGWFALAAVISVLYLLPEAGPPGTANIDKVTHLLAFGSLGFAGLLAAPRPGANARLAISLILAGLLEWLQSFVPGREASVFDGVANLAGLALGIAAALVVRTAILRRHAPVR
jgi:VanZ family protein